ncbi:E3 ubiquitin-protein ligase RNF181-like [Coccinella septempunctata]|uniref:E3 ubiquitin-protein ligase RNF181-like n=1 Tax=Coccinella septempunctata TaxID=41139 RepID=UPI001D05FB1F|nr:E3 ubiquitin-protein ligase RNF181-like [Coccinella septempunctata]
MEEDIFNSLVLALSDVDYRFVNANANIQRLLELYSNTASGLRLPPPAAKHIIENLPDVTITEEAQCIICLKNFSVGDTAKKLPCNHLYDKECIVQWLEKTNTCPMCRFEMETDDEEYEKERKEKLRAKQREAELEILHASMYS